MMPSTTNGYKEDVEMTAVTGPIHSEWSVLTCGHLTGAQVFR